MVGLSGYEAYCFDEAAFYMLSEATNKDGRINWNKFRWQDDTPKNNRNLIEFIKKHG